MPVGTEITINRSSYSVLLHPTNEDGFLTNHASTALIIFRTPNQKSFPVMPCGRISPLHKGHFPPLVLYHCKGRSILCLLQTSLFTTEKTDLKNQNLQLSPFPLFFAWERFNPLPGKLFFVLSRPCDRHEKKAKPCPTAWTNRPISGTMACK